MAETVLVVGATGMLGHQIVERLVARGKRVRALVRPSSRTDNLRAAGVEMVIGDLLEPETLPPAFDGVDAVVTSAAGYTRHTAGDTIETDHIGNRNLIDVAAKTNIPRFVFTSILNCHETPNVPHFWAKKLAEDYLAERRVSFISLRPGGFLEYFGQLGGDGFATGRIVSPGDSAVPRTYVYTPDLAENLAAAVDADVRPGERIDIGWDRPISDKELTSIAAELLGRELTVVDLDPANMRRPDMSDEAFNDFVAMFEYFQSGRYVADTRRQAQVFGSVPTAEDTMRRRLAALGHRTVR